MGELERYRNVTVIIPAYNPDERLVALLNALQGSFGEIILVNDGSSKNKEVFNEARKFVTKFLEHPVNKGKGAALKKGLSQVSSGNDVITADADGQHTLEDIKNVAEALKSHRNGLVLGVRDFKGKVPFRSLFGNFWTRWFFFLMTRLMIRDTQTGLRGIPSSLITRICGLEGERYEFEMAMLADARYHEQKPLQIPIATIYIDENATSHFNPILDTIRIYKSLLKFCLSSVLSFSIDNGVFALMLWWLIGAQNPNKYQILASLAVARIISANFNYFFNRKVVFKTHAPKRSYFQYWLLVIIIGAMSYGLTSSISWVLGASGLAVTAVKISAETFLFISSYIIQKRFIFRGK
jgi:glycosyltransferase involved in cell wall biosynthesis